MRNAHLVENLSHHKVDKVLDIFLTRIKCGHRRDDLDAQARELEHIFKMNGAKRCLARRENEFAAFFDRTIGCAMNEVLAKP